MLSTKLSSVRMASTPRRVVPGVALRPTNRVMALPRRSGALVVRCATAGMAHPSEESAPESSSPRFGTSFSPLMSVPNVTMMAKGGDMGSGGSLGATMERKPLSFVMPKATPQAPKLDDGGSGSGGGKHNHNGGGDGGGGGDDDDDDFMGGEGDGDGGQGPNGDGFKFELGLLRGLIPESYAKLDIQAVLGEWMRTVGDLPLIIRRAVEMGLFSSAQLVRFFSMDVRPGMARTVTRNLPPAWAREFVGRLMADPAFAQKLALETTFAGSASMMYEYAMRGDKFKDELDLALINSLGFAAATSASVWMLAPTRSYGSTHKFPWQQMLDSLPNNVFDASGPLRAYTTGARAASFFTKMAELSAVGAVTGALTSLASSGVVSLRRANDPSFEPSTSVPSVQRSAGGLAAFFALNANVRYQLIGGLDRYLFNHSSFMITYMGLSGLARLASMSVGEMSRPLWQGMPTLAERPKSVRTKRVSKRVHKRVPKMAATPVAAAVMLADGEAAAPMESALRADDASASNAGEEGYASQPAASVSPAYASQPMEMMSAAVPLDLSLPEAATHAPSPVHLGAGDSA
ncbi:hypothetical protein FOA52_010567 [Chlamydomonas sp. UWO 241]|nr:hypothetical protein FOA52_010567 [Chlamydomonas sp. UWO 241]